MEKCVFCATSQKWTINIQFVVQEIALSWYAGIIELLMQLSMELRAKEFLFQWEEEIIICLQMEKYPMLNSRRMAKLGYWT